LATSDWDRRSQNPGGPASASAAAAELERAGFVAVRADVEPLGYRFEPHSFLEWKEYLDDRQLFGGLDRRRRERLVARLRSRLSQLHPDYFIVPDPVVYVTGRRG
jgi:hypothetical protein